MKIVFYSARNYEKPYIDAAAHGRYELVYCREPLGPKTASRARGADAVCIFINDDASGKVLEQLHKLGVRFIAVRAAGHDNIDLARADQLGIVVTNVPSYSPYAIAEHAAALLLALSRKLIIASRQMQQQNFSTDNLVGMDLHGKTVGIIGVGRIGAVFARIMHGFGCRLLGYDQAENTELIRQTGITYVPLVELCREADIISVHIPLSKQTKYLVRKTLIDVMKKGVILINTGRGLTVRTEDVINGLRTNQIGSFGADVYENERGIFFVDHSRHPIHDSMLNKLLGLSNVIITPHQAFATKEALAAIASGVFKSIHAWRNKQLIPDQLAGPHSIDPSGYVDDEES